MDELLATMIAALEVRGKRPATREAYTRCVRRLIEHHGGRDPSELAPEDVEEFLLHLTRTAHLQARSRNVYSSALRFLYTVVLRRPDIAGTIARARVPHRVPVVLNPDEVARLLSALRTPLQRTVATVCYGAGLRIGEAVRLKADDVDAGRGVIHVHDGKGGKSREVPLCPRLLGVLRKWWRHRRPAGPYLFPGRRGRPYVSERSIAIAIRKARGAAGLHKQATPHTLRHSYATDLINAGADLRSLQLALGHASIRTTALYVHVGHTRLASIGSPLERLPG